MFVFFFVGDDDTAKVVPYIWEHLLFALFVFGARFWVVCLISRSTL